MLSYVVSAIWFLRGRLRSTRYDICHTHFIIPTGIVSLWAKRAFGLDYVITAHGSDVPGFNEDRFSFSHRFTGPLLRLICSGAKKITFPSQFLKKMAINNIDVRLAEKSFHIPNGIDVRAIVPLSNKKHIVASGRLLPRKGFQYLVKAVSDYDIGYEVHILGEGPMMPELSKMARASKTKIIFHGWLDNTSDAYRRIIGEAAVYCLPSSKENGSVALLEGMSGGCAMVTTNISGCPETVGEAGITVDPNNDAAIKQALDRIIRDPDMMNGLRNNAQKRVRQVFNWDRIMDQYESVLEL